MSDHHDPPPPLLGVSPESLAAWKSGWTKMDETKAFTVIDEEEFFDDQLGESPKNALDHTAESADQALTPRGRGVSPVSVFQLSSEPAVDKIVQGKQRQADTKCGAFSQPRSCGPRSI